jgi:POT family proton-dependent oligopeptide transporter
MRALLTLYLTKHFLFSDQTTNGLYGGFTALVYLTPLIGGYLADRYLGSKRSVKFGAVLMAVGYFILCFGGETAKPHAVIDGTRYEVQVENAIDRPTSTGQEQRYIVDHDQRLLIRGNEDGTVSLVDGGGQVARTIAAGTFQADADRSPLFVMLMLVGLSLVAVGNGFFKPNISTIVGSLYEQGDRRRDAGFTIFYMGINLGSFFSQLFCPFLADHVGWWAGFGLAAGGMLLAACLFQFDGGRLDGYGERPEGVDGGRDFHLCRALIVVPVVRSCSDERATGAGRLRHLALPIMGRCCSARPDAIP